MERWLTEGELLGSVGISRSELRWFSAQFHEQMRLLTRRDQEEGLLFHGDAVALLRGLSAMVAQGATPEQIKAWFGLAAGQQP